MKSKVPQLNLNSIKKSHRGSIFAFTDIDPNEFGTFVTKDGDDSFVNDKASVNVSKRKI